MNHDWQYHGDPAEATERSCALCPASGRRSSTGHSLTRWETRTEPGSDWEGGHVPPCTGKRPGGYVMVGDLLLKRLVADKLAPEDATVHSLPRRGRRGDNPAWEVSWTGPDGYGSLYSRYPMRQCAEAASLSVGHYGQVTPSDDSGDVR